MGEIFGSVMYIVLPTLQVVRTYVCMGPEKTPAVEYLNRVQGVSERVANISVYLEKLITNCYKSLIEKLNHVWDKLRTSFFDTLPYIWSKL